MGGDVGGWLCWDPPPPHPSPPRPPSPPLGVSAVCELRAHVAVVVVVSGQHEPRQSAQLRRCERALEGLLGGGGVR